jgi:uncharacterized glyoxalase superfamily protein PhnB
VPERPVVDQLNLVVSDMEAALAFYRLVGVEVSGTLAIWEPHHRSARSGLDLDFDSAAFARQWNAGSRGPGVVIGFKFGSRQDVDDAFARLTAAGHRAQQAPYDAFWGARYAVVEDPDGNAVGLMSPIDPAVRSEPPDPATGPA